MTTAAHFSDGLLRLFQSAPFALCSFSREGEFGLCNKTFLELFSISQDECSGLHFSDVTHPDDIDECRRRVDQLWSGEVPSVVLEMRHIRRNGGIFWAQSSIYLHDEGGGRPVSIVAIMTDITEQKEIEAERLRRAVETERTRTAAGHEGDRMQRTVQELEMARESAEKVAQRKSELLAVMSHEFRTPMSGVIGMTELLLQTPLTKGQRELVETIHSSGENLLAIINDVLDYSKIEAGRIELEHEAFDVRGCIEAALSFVTPRAATKGIDVAYLVEPDVPDRIHGDIMRLRQILINLLNNAVKFTEDGEVLLTLRVTDQEGEPVLHFSVKDTGIGIAEDRMSGLFKSFSQLDPSTARKYGGTGLGLAISKRLTELLGGRMWAESQIDVGSTFHFTVSLVAAAAGEPLPSYSGRRALVLDGHRATREMIRRQLSRYDLTVTMLDSASEALESLSAGEFDVALIEFDHPSPTDAPLVQALAATLTDSDLPIIFLHRLGQHVREPELDVAGTLAKPVKEGPLRDALTAAFSGTYKKRSAKSTDVPKFSAVSELSSLRVLLAEDNPVNQKVAVRMLQKLGYEAAVANNGVEALEKLDEAEFDVVLMDIMMPEMDGIETTRKILERYSEEERPRVIALTANAMRGDRDRCLAAGMDDYLSKPLRVNQLGEALERCMPVGRRSGGGDGAGGGGAVDLDVEPSVPSVNLEILEQLNFMLGGGDAGFLADLVDEFLTDADELMEEIRASIEAASARRLHQAAHTLKSSAALFGAAKMSMTCEELESMGSDDRLDDAPTMLSRLAVQFAAVTDDLRKQVKQKV